MLAISCKACLVQPHSSLQLRGSFLVHIVQSQSTQALIISDETKPEDTLQLHSLHGYKRELV